MKNKIMIFLGLFVFIFGMNNVNAMTLKPTGDSNGKRGENLTLYITLERSDSEKTISAVEGTLSYDSNVLELVSSSKLMSDWQSFSEVSNGGVFSYANITFNQLINSTGQSIVKMIFKVNSNANYGNTTITISNPSATDDKGNSVVISGGTHNVKVLSDVNTLSGIKISNGTINFNDNTTEYNLTIDSDSTNISATKKDSSSSVSGDGKKTLNYGVNTFKITVTSESGKSKVYTINITRPDNRSKENDLIKFGFNGYDIGFNKDKTEYFIEVENNISRIATCDSKSIKENMICMDEESLEFSDKADVLIYFNDVNFEDIELDFKEDCNDDDNCIYYLGDEIVGISNKEVIELYMPFGELKVGKNILKVVVVAENETEKIYTFNINRKSNVSETEKVEIEDKIENPKTGDKVFLIVTICVIGILSLILVIYYFNKRKKKMNNI